VVAAKFFAIPLPFFLLEISFLFFLPGRWRAGAFGQANRLSLSPQRPVLSPLAAESLPFADFPSSQCFPLELFPRLPACQVTSNSQSYGFVGPRLDFFGSFAVFPSAPRQRHLSGQSPPLLFFGPGAFGELFPSNRCHFWTGPYLADFCPLFLRIDPFFPPSSALPSLRFQSFSGSENPSPVAP